MVHLFLIPCGTCIMVDNFFGAPRRGLTFQNVPPPILGTHIRHRWWRNELVSPTTGTTLCVTTMIDVDLMSLRRHWHLISSYHCRHLLHLLCLRNRWSGGAVTSNRSKLDPISTTSPFVESGGWRFSTPWSPTVDLKSSLQSSENKD